MVPMAIPSVGGMCIALLSVLIVPVIFSWWEERKLDDDGRKLGDAERELAAGPEARE